MYDTDIDPFNFDEGTESTPTVSDVEESQADTPDAASTVDSAKETPKVDSTGTDATEKTDESEKVSDESTEEEKTPEQILADVDKEIADEKHPKWYRNNLENVKNNYLKQTAAITAQLEPLKAFGETDKIVSDLELIKGLETVEIDPISNQPVKTAKPFVEKLIETKGEEAGERLMNALAFRPSPYTKGYTYLDEVIKSIGLDPHRLSDFKQFASNGYQLAQNDINSVAPNELALIPENLREAYISMSPEDRLEFAPYDGESPEEAARRERLLKPIQFELDVKRQQESDKAAETSRAQQEEQAKIQKFNTDWANETANLQIESGNRLTTSFVETLVKDADLTKGEALGNAYIINNAIRGFGVEKQQSLDFLKEEGITLNEELPGLFKKWEQATETAANCKLNGKDEEFKTLQKEIESLEKSISAKVNPVVAHFAEKSANTMKTRSDKKNALLTETQKFNKGIKPNEGKAEVISPGIKSMTETEREAILANPYAA